MLSIALGQPQKKLRFDAENKPKTFLPSVDRPWPLGLQRAMDVYGFRPTPLEEVMKRCEAFFQEGCSKFPYEARKAAKKLPSESAKMALKIAGLNEIPNSSSDSSSS